MHTIDPCALLERLLIEDEAEWLEFKTDNDDPEIIGQYVSALANAAMLCDRDRAFLVYGIENNTKSKIGTTVNFSRKKKGGEVFKNWLTRMIEPKLTI